MLDTTHRINCLGNDLVGAAGFVADQGARVLNTLLFEMRRRGAKKGLATLCIGGGMGVAMCFEAM